MLRDRTASMRAKAIQSLALGSLVALAACTFVIGPPSVPRPDIVYEPDLVGRITNVTHDGISDTYTVTVAGETFDIGPDAVRLEGSPGRSDSFLIYGTDNGTAWYASIGIGSIEPWAGCAILYTPDAWDAGEAILFAFTSDADSDAVVGIKLPKADEWDEDINLEPDGRYPRYYDWCLDLHGRVVSAFPSSGA